MLLPPCNVLIDVLDNRVGTAAVVALGCSRSMTRTTEFALGSAPGLLKITFYLHDDYHQPSSTCVGKDLMPVQVEDGARRHPQGLHRAAERALPA